MIKANLSRRICSNLWLLTLYNRGSTQKCLNLIINAWSKYYYDFMQWNRQLLIPCIWNYFHLGPTVCYQKSIGCTHTTFCILQLPFIYLFLYSWINRQLFLLGRSKKKIWQLHQVPKIDCSLNSIKTFFI